MCFGTELRNYVAKSLAFLHLLTIILQLLLLAHAKAEMLNKYFFSCFNKSCPPVSAHTPSPPPFPCPQNLKCTTNEIFHLLSCLPSDTSPGLDKISAKMLKSTAQSISSPLSLIFNSSLSSGVFPADWKNAVVIPIPKTSAHSSSPSDYRPISLLSLVSKIFERHVFNVLSNIISANNILCNNQFGFRAGFSTECALLAVTHHWLNTLECNKSICAVFFDLSKAFDSVPHDPLLHTLCNLGLPAHLLCWFRSYLTDRFQQVSISSCL